MRKTMIREEVWHRFLHDIERHDHDSTDGTLDDLFNRLVFNVLGYEIDDTPEPEKKYKCEYCRDAKVLPHPLGWQFGEHVCTDCELDGYAKPEGVFVKAGDRVHTITDRLQRIVAGKTCDDGLTVWMSDGSDGFLKGTYSFNTYNLDGQRVLGYAKGES